LYHVTESSRFPSSNLRTNGPSKLFTSPPMLRLLVFQFLTDFIWADMGRV
jgi:hypothetical protein